MSGAEADQPGKGDPFVWHEDVCLPKSVFKKMNIDMTLEEKLNEIKSITYQDGDVLDILVQSRRSKKAAKRFFRKLLKGLCYAPREIITDKLKSYGAAKREVMPGVEHRQDKGSNNRAEVSHQATRQRERHMRRFKSPGQAQRFLSAHGPINNLFRVSRHLLKAEHYRCLRNRAFSTWSEVTCTSSSAS